MKQIKSLKQQVFQVQPDVDDINEKYSTTASNEGGLMAAPKKKKKRQPKKGGLAGKK